MAKSKRQDGQAAEETPVQETAPAQAAPASGPRLTGVITILEDGTVATNGVTAENAAGMAKLMLRIAAELVEVSAAGGTS